jgi:hypothetical protein
VSQITKRPEAEVLVDTETVRALLKTQHADLADLPLSEVAAGWDNVTFRLGEAMAVRLPAPGSECSHAGTRTALAPNHC